MEDLNKTMKFHWWYVYDRDGNQYAKYGYECYAKEICEHPDYKQLGLYYAMGEERTAAKNVLDYWEETTRPKSEQN